MHKSAVAPSPHRGTRPITSWMIGVLACAALSACSSSGLATPTAPPTRPSAEVNDQLMASIRAACKSDVKNVEIAAEAYYAKNGQYPTTMTQLVAGGFLREAPGSTNYTIRLNPASGSAGPAITGTVNRTKEPC